jgi:hypothetical protein
LKVKFITLTLQHVSTQHATPDALVSKKDLKSTSSKPLSIFFSTSSTYCNSTRKIATPRFANFFLELLAS